MHTAAAPQHGVPFESASELREQHSRLLEALDHAMAHDASAEDEAGALRRIEPQLRAFLERAGATGLYLEDVGDRTGCQALLDYWASSLAQVGVQSPATRLAAFDGSQLPDLKDKPCPYVGLEAFRGREFFFGREEDTKTLVEQLRASPLLVVLGASGSGKSSLIMGGVLPALQADSTLGLRVAPVFVPGNALLAHLADAVLQLPGAPRSDAEAEAATLLADPLHIVAMLGLDAAPTLITIDQFEEVFTLSDAAARDAAAAALAAFLQRNERHRLIVTMREEFRSRLVELPALTPYLDKAWYAMRPMGYAALREAVERPATLVNLQFEAGIVDDLVKKVLGQPAALPLLQFTLRELWNRRDRNRITREVYRKVGDPLNALKSAADGFYDGQAPQTQVEIKRILLDLVRVDELLEAYRQPVLKSALLRAGKANTEEVLQLLADNDYVRITAGDGDADRIVEVKHESLIRNWPRLIGWIDEKRIQRRQRLALTQTAQRWAASGKPREGLLTGWQLQEAARQADLSDFERDFVQASEAEIDRAQREREAAFQREAEQARALARRERRLRVGTTIALVIVAALMILNFSLFRNAVHEQQQAERIAAIQRRDTIKLSELTTELSRAAAEQKQQYDYLQAEYNQLFAKQVQQAVAPQSHLPSSQPVSIYIHIGDERQRPRAEDIRQQLVKNKIGAAPGIEFVPNSPRASQVRYFRPEDRRGAEEIKRLLDEYLGVTQIETAHVKGYESKVPGRRYEIWFGLDAFGAAAQSSTPRLRSDASPRLR